MTQEQENTNIVDAFYKATIPGHREALWGIQAPDVVYDLPLGMPIGCGHFVGLKDVLERFLTASTEHLTFTLSPKSSSPRVKTSWRSVVSRVKPEKLPCPSMYHSLTSGQSVRDVSTDCVLSRTLLCWLMRSTKTELATRRKTRECFCTAVFMGYH
jgi:hypothetical protein